MTLWMVRSASGGRLADEFVEKGFVALGAAPVGELSQFQDKQALLEALQKQRPEHKLGKRQAAASQWIRFRDAIQRGDKVVVIEINDNPNIDEGVEDGYYGNRIYQKIIQALKKRIDRIS